jgi:hypothetical protein
VHYNAQKVTFVEQSNIGYIAGTKKQQKSATIRGIHCSTLLIGVFL